MKFIWVEDGWYDCCGGGWFTHFNLIDDLGNQIYQVYTENEAKCFTYALNHYLLYEPTWDDVRKLAERFDGIEFVIDEAVSASGGDYDKLLTGIDFEIQYDDTIDFDTDYCCHH